MFLTIYDDNAIIITTYTVSGRDNMKKDETNRERFVRIAESRTQKIIDMLELLGNCSNPYSYEYSQKDVDKMYGAIEAALKESKARYNEPKKKDSKFKF